MGNWTGGTTELGCQTHESRAKREERNCAVEREGGEREGERERERDSPGGLISQVLFCHVAASLALRDFISHKKNADAALDPTRTPCKCIK